MSDQQVVTTVSANGRAEADFDTARFTAKAEATGKTGPKAKEKLKEVASKLRSLYDAYEKEGIAEKIRTTVSVKPDYSYENRSHKLVGYTATYSMSFRTSNLDQVSRVHDALTGLEGVAVNEPTFGVKDQEQLSREALEDAFRKCQGRFSSECKILGKDASQFEVGTWSVEYGDRHGGVRSVKALSAAVEMGDGGDAIAIESGKAEITTHLRVSYVRKR